MKESSRPLHISIRDSDDSPMNEIEPRQYITSMFAPGPSPGTAETLAFAATKLSQSQCYRYWCYSQIVITFGVLCFILWDIKAHWDKKLVEILMNLLVCCIIIDIIWNVIIHGIKKLIFQYWFILDVLSLVTFGGVVIYMAVENRLDKYGEEAEYLVMCISFGVMVWKLVAA